ncbi:MAG: alpha-ribazole phosphatase family protein [Pseudomonas sp.]
MTLRLSLLRHGETELAGGFRGSIDDALTSEGWAQMRAAVAEQGPWDVIVSSPLQRCAAFARELASERGVPLHLDADLRELHFGAWEGQTALALMADQEAELGQFWNDPYTFTPPGGEPVLAFSQRVLVAIERLVAEHGGKRVLVISHGGVIRLLLAQARGLPREQLLQVEAGHASVHRLDVHTPFALQEA